MDTWDIVETIVGLGTLASALGPDVKLECHEDFSQCWVGNYVVDVDNYELFDRPDRDHRDDDDWAILASIYISTRHGFDTAEYYLNVVSDYRLGKITLDDARHNVGLSTN
jgi:hypothetical protein